MKKIARRTRLAASLLCLLVPAAAASAAKVKKVDDTTVDGHLAALEGGKLVLTKPGPDGKPPVRSSVPLQDVVEVTVEPNDILPDPAAVAAATQPASGNARFDPIFDGRTLGGWAGDAAFWSVRDGALTGITPDGQTADASTFIHWQGPGGAELTDFELRFRYKITGGHAGSSGLLYRAKVLDAATFRVGGYQFDLGDDPGLSGSLYDEGGVAGKRETLANVGEKVILKPDGSRRLAPDGLPKNAIAIREAIKPGDWNDAVVIVRRNHFTHLINGNVVADVTDESPAALKAGVLAFQLDHRRPVTVQFKDIRLQRGRGMGGGGGGSPASAPAGNDAAPRPWVVHLTGGDRLTGELVSWDERQLTLKTAHGDAALPAKILREVWHADAAAVTAARAAHARARAATEDVALARGKDEQVVAVAGLARGSDGKALSFRFKDQDRKIAVERLVGVILAALGDEPATPGGPADAFHQSLDLAGGDVVSGAWTALDEKGSLHVRPLWGGGELRVPVANVARVRCRNGRLVYLSDLRPAAVEQVPYFDRLMPYRVDASLAGGPIQLADGAHARGVAVHARTVLQYDVAGRFDRFRCTVGFQQPEGKAGRAVVRVRGDDKVLYEAADLRGDQKPVPLDLPLSSVRRLMLEVDFGEDEDVADRVVWANARLLRADPPQ